MARSRKVANNEQVAEDEEESREESRTNRYGEGQNHRNKFNRTLLSIEARLNDARTGDLRKHILPPPVRHDAKGEPGGGRRLRDNDAGPRMDRNLSAVKHGSVIYQLYDRSIGRSG